MKNFSSQRAAFAGFSLAAFVLAACSTLPDPKHTWAKFPENAYLQKPARPYDIVGSVRAKVNFATLDPSFEESTLCKNYFNVATKKLLEYGTKKGADAVMEVRSVVFLLDGKTETYPRAECSDDGAEGQILAQGVAIKWKPATPSSPDSQFDDPWGDIGVPPAAKASNASRASPAAAASPAPLPGDPRARLKRN